MEPGIVNAILGIVNAMIPIMWQYPVMGEECSLSIMVAFDCKYNSIIAAVASMYVSYHTYIITWMLYIWNHQPLQVSNI